MKLPGRGRPIGGPGGVGRGAVGREEPELRLMSETDAEVEPIYIIQDGSNAVAAAQTLRTANSASSQQTECGRAFQSMQRDAGARRVVTIVDA